LVGNLIEHGPYVLDWKGNVKSNPWTITKFASVFYLDNPIGTGFSFVNNKDAYRTEETSIANDLFVVINTLITKSFPEYTNAPIFIAGESYAGKYLPNIANLILDKKDSDPSFKMNFKGIALGDALVDPVIQRVQYPGQLFANGIFDDYDVQEMEAINQRCSRYILQEDWTQANKVCDYIAEYFVLKSGDVNVYDLRAFGIPFNRSAMIEYVQQASFYQSIGLPSDESSRKWVECSKDVKFYLGDDRMQSALPILRKLIESDRTKVLLYNGQFDMKDGPLGTQAFLKTIPSVVNTVWNKNNPRKIVNASSSSSGDESNIIAYLREYNKLAFVIVTSAGHFSPMVLIFFFIFDI
jgi:vitellogenic carboxypeptidase-like protein